MHSRSLQFKGQLRDLFGKRVRSHRGECRYRKEATEFQRKAHLPNNLLADTDKKVIEAYGVWGPKKFMGREYDGIHRTSFVIDENGIIEKVIDKVKAKIHALQILES